MLNRKWLSFELIEGYFGGSIFKFDENSGLFPENLRHGTKAQKAESA